jgi:phenylacetate-CoA ligase
MDEQIKLKIYGHSPISIQNMMCSSVGRKLNQIRYGENFDKWTKFYNESVSWSEGELKEYQREKMVELIRHCFSSVPFYQKRWGSMGLAPNDFKDLDDLSKLPYTTKEDLRNNQNKMIDVNFDQRELLRSTTSGSTGTPTACYFTQDELQRHYAIFWNRMRQGVSRGDRYASFQGRDVVPLSQKLPPFWRENYSSNQRLYSINHLSTLNLKNYIDSLSKEPFVYYQGFGSVLRIIAEYMEKNGLHLTHIPKAVFTTGEVLDQISRNLIENVWKTKVWDEYCQYECCALIRQCEHGNYHPQMDYGIIEYVPIGDDDGYLQADMICTGFIPFAAPLVRYLIGDRVLLDTTGKCPCGAPGPVIKGIEGRMSNIIVTRNGRKYPCIHSLGKILRNVRRTQIVQEDEDNITIRVVPYPEFDKKDESYLITQFKKNIGVDINIKVVKVNEVERSKSGKTYFIINKIRDIEELEKV